MSNYSDVIGLINAQIKTNGLKAITGAKLNGVLLEMVEELGAGYQYKGVATPATDPGTPDENVFYIATEPGNYTNFGGLAVSDGEVAILKGTGSTWTKEVTGAATAAQVSQLGQILNTIDDEPTAESNNLVKSGGVFDKVAPNSAFSHRLHGSKYLTDSERVALHIPVNFKTGDKIVFECSDTQGSTVLAFILWSDDASDAKQITSGYIVDSDHEYKYLKLYRSAATFSTVTYKIEMFRASEVQFEKDVEKRFIETNKVNLELSSTKRDADININGTIKVSTADTSSTFKHTDFIDVSDLNGLFYHLGGMVGAMLVSFYTEKNFASQLTQYNIEGTGAIGTGKAEEGLIFAKDFPQEAKYVVLCGVTPGQYYSGENYAYLYYNIAKKVDKLDKEVFPETTNILYDKTFRTSGDAGRFVGNPNISAAGIDVSASGTILALDYGLAQRKVNIYCTFEQNAVAHITSYPTHDSDLVIDASAKTFNLNNLEEVSIPFFDVTHKYAVSIIRNYQHMVIEMVDLNTGNKVSKDYVNNGTGGSGSGAIGTAYLTGEFHDNYYFKSESDSAIWHMSRLQILSFSKNYNLIMYGDSITEVDAYYPTSMLEQSWVMKFVNNIKGSVASGRGGGQISGLIARLQNEIAVGAKYIMITIGTNGGNTLEHLRNLIDFILANNAIPILNHIPCNSNDTQVSVNAMIDTIRAEYGIKGIDFDLCTSINGDGQTLNPDMMWYDTAALLHPNVQGSNAMYIQALKDMPELFVL